jgi:hypothetical protein
MALAMAPRQTGTGNWANALYECDKQNDRGTLRGVYCGSIL